MNLVQEKEAVKKMGVVNLTSVWLENSPQMLQEKAAHRCNLTPEVISAIENGEEVWIRNNTTGFIDRATAIKRLHSEEDLRIWREAKTEPLRKATGKAYWMECREKGYEIRDWAYLEKVERPRSETPWLASVALQTHPGLGAAPVVICGHGLDQLDLRQIHQDEVVAVCLHGETIQQGYNDRIVRSLLVRDRRSPEFTRRELHVVIKKNYEAQACEVITAWWRDERPENS